MEGQNDTLEDSFCGKDCPQGKVQIQFVGVDPKLRISDYTYQPTDYAFLEIYVDGQRYNIQIGTYESSKGPRRGLHIVTDTVNLKVDHHSLNAVDLYMSTKEPRLLIKEF